MSTPEERGIKLDGRLVNDIAADPYNMHVIEKLLAGPINHPVKDWTNEMREHSAEKYDLSPESDIIKAGLAKCFDLQHWT